jgi:hypothetical protein
LPEYDRDDQGTWKKASPGAMLDNAIVRRDLFYLLTMFAGCEPIMKLRRDLLDVLYNDLFESEIAHRLATTASFLRARDDYIDEEIERRGSDDETRTWARKLRSKHCGTLRKDATSSRTVPLDLREACNKIIHSREYVFRIAGEDTARHITPFLDLHGRSNGGQKWHAVLDVLCYIEIGMDYTAWN